MNLFSQRQDRVGRGEGSTQGNLTMLYEMQQLFNTE
jgi:hypothetical protein